MVTMLFATRTHVQDTCVFKNTKVHTNSSPDYTQRRQDRVLFKVMQRLLVSQPHELGPPWRGSDGNIGQDGRTLRGIAFLISESNSSETLSPGFFTPRAKQED